MHAVTTRVEGRSRPRVPLAFVPLLCYLGVTVVEPALNGAIGRAGFWEHAAITLITSVLLTWAWLATTRAARKNGGPIRRVAGD